MPDLLDLLIYIISFGRRFEKVVASNKLVGNNLSKIWNFRTINIRLFWRTTF